jgi:hypothetical protein
MLASPLLSVNLALTMTVRTSDVSPYPAVCTHNRTHTPYLTHAEALGLIRYFFFRRCPRRRLVGRLADGGIGGVE